MTYALVVRVGDGWCLQQLGRWCHGRHVDWWKLEQVLDWLDCVGWLLQVGAYLAQVHSHGQPL